MLLYFFPHHGDKKRASTALAHRRGWQALIFSIIASHIISFNFASFNWLPKGVALAQESAIGRAIGGLKTLFFQTQLYVSRDGDSLAQIAQRYNISLAGLLYLNKNRNLTRNNQPLPVASVITVPMHPLSKAEAQRLDEELGLHSNLAKDINQQNSADRAAPLAQAMLRQGNFAGLEGRQVLKQAASSGFNAANERISSWLNHYGSLRLSAGFADSLAPSEILAEMLLPFSDSGDRLIFGQALYANNKLASHLSAGLGARFFLDDIALGANAFIDYGIKTGHGRFGLGAEYWRDYIRAAANGYFALSSWQASDLIRDEIHYQERVANGFDIGGEAYLPSYPQLGIKGAYEQYFGDNVNLSGAKSLAKDPYRLSFGFSYTPIPLLKIELDYKQQAKQAKAQIGAKLTYRLGVALQDQLDASFVDNLRRLSGARYAFVERNNEIILNYQKDIAIELNEISGFEGQSFALVAHADLGNNWELKQWDNPANLALSEQCYDSLKLGQCKITLPKYKAGDLTKDNIYNLTLILNHKKTGQEQRYKTSISVKYNQQGDEFELITRPEEQLVAAPATKIALFSKAEIGARWKYQSWSIKVPAHEQELKPEDVLSPECFAIADIAKCQLTFPAIKGEARQVYILEAHFVNAALGQNKTIRTQFTVDPSGLFMVPNNPIILNEGKIGKLFKEGNISDFWYDPQWRVPDNFIQNGGKLSPACYLRDALFDCEVTMPRYQRVSGKDSKNEIAQNRYELILLLTNQNHRSRSDSWILTTKPAHSDIALDLVAPKNDLSYGEVLPVEVYLSQDGKPVDIAPQDLDRYFKLSLLRNEQPDNNQGNWSSVTPLQRLSAGRYLFNVKAGNIDELFTVRLVYGDKQEKTLNIIVSGVIDPKRVTLQLDNDILLLASLEGRSALAQYRAYSRYGTLVDFSRLNLRLETLDGQPADKAALFSPPIKGDNMEQLSFYAKKEGAYKLKLYYKVKDNKQQLLAQRDVFFIAGKPSAQSKLAFTPNAIAPDDSAGFPANTKLLFEAYDEYGHPIDYDKLTKDRALIDKIKPKFFDAQKQALPLDAKFTYEGKNRFSWSGIDLALWRDLAKAKDLGSYYAHVFAGDSDIGIEAPLTILGQNVVPDKVRIEPSAQELYLSKGSRAIIDYQFYKYGLAILVPQAPISFKVFRDGKETNILPHVARRDSSISDNIANRVTIDFSEPGDYIVKAFYNSFHNPSRAIEIASSSAIVKVLKNGGRPDPKLSSFTISQDQLAPDDRGGYATKAHLRFTAKDAYGAPLDYNTLIATKDINAKLKLVVAAFDKEGRRHELAKKFTLNFDDNKASCPEANCFTWDIDAGAIYDREKLYQNYEAQVLFDEQPASKVINFVISPKYTIPSLDHVTPAKTPIFDKDKTPSVAVHFAYRLGHQLYDQRMRERIVYSYSFAETQDGEARDSGLPPELLKRVGDEDIITLVITKPGFYKIKASYQSYHNPSRLIPIIGASAEVVFYDKVRGVDYDVRRELPHLIAGVKVEYEVAATDAYTGADLDPESIKLVVYDKATNQILGDDKLELRRVRSQRGGAAYSLYPKTVTGLRLVWFYKSKDSENGPGKWQVLLRRIAGIDAPAG